MDYMVALFNCSDFATGNALGTGVGTVNEP